MALRLQWLRSEQETWFGSFPNMGVLNQYLPPVHQGMQVS